MASGVGTRVWVSIALGNGVKVRNEVWVGIALAEDDIVAVGSVVDVADAQAASRPDSKNITMVLFFIFLTLQRRLFPIADMCKQDCYSGGKAVYSTGAKGGRRNALIQL